MGSRTGDRLLLLADGAVRPGGDLGDFVDRPALASILVVDPVDDAQDRWLDAVACAPS